MVKLLTYIQQFEERAFSYYTELGSVLTTYSPEDISHIILCCGVHWTVTDGNIIEDSIIFPYLDDCYLFPFTLVWRIYQDSQEGAKANIENYCRQTLKNLDVNNLFLSFDLVCSYDIYRLQ